MYYITGKRIKAARIRILLCALRYYCIDTFSNSWYTFCNDKKGYIMTAKAIFIILTVLGGNQNNAVQYTFTPGTLARAGLPRKIIFLVKAVQGSKVHTKVRIAALNELRVIRGKKGVRLFRSLLRQVKSPVIRAHIRHILLEMGALTSLEQKAFINRQKSLREFFKGVSALPRSTFALAHKNNFMIHGKDSLTGALRRLVFARKIPNRQVVMIRRNAAIWLKDFHVTYGSSYIRSYTVAGFGNKKKLGLFVIMHGHFHQKDMYKDWKRSLRFSHLRKKDSIKGVYSIHQLDANSFAAFYRNNMLILAGGNKSEFALQNLKLLLRRILLSKRAMRLPAKLRPMYKRQDLDNSVLLYLKNEDGLLQKGLNIQHQGKILSAKVRIKNIMRGLFRIKIELSSRQLAKQVVAGWKKYRNKLFYSFGHGGRPKMQSIIRKIAVYLKSARVFTGKSSGRTIFVEFSKPVNLLYLFALLMG